MTFSHVCRDGTIQPGKRCPSCKAQPVRSASSRVTGHRRFRRVRLQALKRDGYRCQLQLPGCTETAEVADHIIPVSRGGEPFSLSNLQASCRRCNGRKNAKLIPS